ncbi:hypothetical protein FH972_017861 [Carpinus fangiana]|uniref:Uncharacterized protein n=1 Tax=Carpinus fangiana TaxID=176857 RepID=A0A5N6RN67_9ROSI|nr:hypothetical protein FH972_017861 [Carpinus fangiana]
MKLFGTIVYPKNRYLTLQFPRGGKNVMCEDYFDNMIVFSEAWWIGRKDENPEEARLNFPKDVDEGHVVEYDFKGGAGAASVNNPSLHKTGMIYVDEQSPKAELEVDLSDGENNLKDLIKATPVRHSERTAGKSFNFAEASSGEDSVGSDADVSEGEEKKVVGVDSSTTKYTSGNILIILGYVALDNDNKDAVERTLFPEKNEESAMSVSKSKRLSHTATAVTTDKERSSSNNGSLVQATISTLFKKAEEKKAPRNPRKAPSPKVSDQKLLHSNSKRKINEMDWILEASALAVEEMSVAKKMREKEVFEILNMIPQKVRFCSPSLPVVLSTSGVAELGLQSPAAASLPLSQGGPSKKAKVIKETDGGGRIMVMKKEDEAKRKKQGSTRKNPDGAKLSLNKESFPLKTRKPPYPLKD